MRHTGLSVLRRGSEPCGLGAPIKALVDHHTVHVVVTGSSALRIEAGRDSLAGRVAPLDLGTLLLREIAGFRLSVDVGPSFPANGLETCFGATSGAGSKPMPWRTGTRGTKPSARSRSAEATPLRTRTPPRLGRKSRTSSTRRSSDASFSTICAWGIGAASETRAPGGGLPALLSLAGKHPPGNSDRGGQAVAPREHWLAAGPQLPAVPRRVAARSTRPAAQAPTQERYAEPSQALRRRPRLPAELAGGDHPTCIRPTHQVPPLTDLAGHIAESVVALPGCMPTLDIAHFPSV